MKKIFLLFTFLFAITIAAQSQNITGEYKVGDMRCTIKIVNDEVRVYWEGVDGSSLLKYKENIITGEQIWIERSKGKTIGNFILLNDYSSGKYVRYPEVERFEVTRIQ